MVISIHIHESIPYGTKTPHYIYKRKVYPMVIMYHTPMVKKYHTPMVQKYQT